MSEIDAIQDVVTFGPQAGGDGAVQVGQRP
jgi:hypothetical protein